ESRAIGGGESRDLSPSADDQPIVLEEDRAPGHVGADLLLAPKQLAGQVVETHKFMVRDEDEPIGDENTSRGRLYAGAERLTGLVTPNRLPVRRRNSETRPPKRDNDDGRLKRGAAVHAAQASSPSDARHTLAELHRARAVCGGPGGERLALVET